VASPLNEIRLFDGEEEKDVRVTFYRDHASWCPYCQKVWMFLEEKRVSYRVEKINMRCYGEKPPSFQRLQPSGAIPVAEIDGVVYRQSNDIMYVLEESFPGKSMVPATERAQSLLRLERELFSAWMYWLTGSERSEGGFLRVLGRVEEELASVEGGFFLGKEVSVVDCMFAPFLERVAASMIYFKGLPIRVPKGSKSDHPAINRWFDAMETLPSYTLTKGCHYSHCWDLPPQLGGCTRNPRGEPYRNAIDGRASLVSDKLGWDLPLEPHLGGAEPDWDWCGDESAARREAVERLTFNHEAIVGFAARGSGKRGVPYSAPLADPTAVPDDAIKGSVDACLRVVCLAMLRGHEEVEGRLDGLVREAKEGGKAEDLVRALSYLRDRIGVPRDMRLPAARQLRGHLNFVIGKMV